MTTEAEVAEYATRVKKALTDLGFAYETKRGDRVEVTFKSLQAGDRYALLEVDTSRLPPRVSIPKIEAPEVLQHLSAVVGKPVKRLNTVGLTYVVMTTPPPRPRPWPNRVDLPDEAPEGFAYAWPFGVTRDRSPIWGDLLKIPQMLVGGKPGSGKSTFVNAGLVALLRRHSPETLRLVLVDPKSVELWPYAGLPHLALPVATDPEPAAQAVTWLVGEVARREALFKAEEVKSLPAFNAKAPAPLPLVLAVFDEFTDLTLAWGGPKSATFLELTRVSSKARAFGVVLLLATQNPKAEILDTAIRENSGVRVALKVDQAAQSRSILGQPGAEALPVGRPGRLAVVGLGSGLQVLQGFAVEDNQVAALARRLKTEAPLPLTPLEAALAVFARDRLGGAFRLRDLHAFFARVISWRQLGKLGRSWEARGWLTPPPDAVSPRRLTEELLRLTRGVAPELPEAVTRSQGSQATTGDEEAVTGPDTGPQEAPGGEEDRLGL